MTLLKNFGNETFSQEADDIGKLVNLLAMA